MRRDRTVWMAGIMMGLVLLQAGCGSRNGTSAIRKGSAVLFQYAMEADGTPVVPPSNPEMMQLTVGDGVFPPAFERELLGMTVGAQKNITLRPEQAFGPFRPELVQRVPKTQLPPDLALTEGMLIGGKGQATMRVAKILDDSVVLDQNHPFAGKTLVYRIQILESK